MPHEFQVLRAGTVLYGTLRLAAATPTQAALLRWAWETITSEGLRLGGQSARGYGRASAQTDWADTMPEPDFPIHTDGLLEMLAEAAGR